MSAASSVLPTYLPWTFHEAPWGTCSILDQRGEVVLDDEQYYPRPPLPEIMKFIVESVNRAHPMTVGGGWDGG